MEELKEKIQIADALKLDVLKAKERLDNAKSHLKGTALELKSHESSLSKVSSRLKELESGKGRDLVHLKDTHIYEFWIETPSYSGPIRGTSATVRQTGSLQHIPITTGKSKGGFAGAAFGAQVAGPTGAAVGGILGRKNEVETTIKIVDTRQFHVDIKGKSWAWSMTLGSEYSEKSIHFRDLINVVGSSNDNLNELLSDQRQLHDLSSSKRLQLFDASTKAKFDLSASEKEYRSIKTEYKSKRAPFWQDAKFRWARTGTPKRVLLSIVGPLPVGVCLLSPVAILSGHLATTSAIAAVTLGIVYTAILVYLYLSKVRLF